MLGRICRIDNFTIAKIGAVATRCVVRPAIGLEYNFRSKLCRSCPGFLVGL